MSARFEQLVTSQMELFTQGKYREVERSSAERRVAWIRQNAPASSSSGVITPRQAYEALFFNYMGLAREDVAVVEESDTRIAWRSSNPCPTLEACLRLDLDPRRVCRSIAEKPAQAFLSQLNPRLRFMRSYTEIRPHAPYCLEWIERVDFEMMMRLAVNEARSAGLGGGAVVCRGNQILARTRGDHAAANALLQAQRAGSDLNLSGAILFSPVEPCPECTSRAIRANLTTIVFGVSREMTLQSGNNGHTVADADLTASGVPVEFIGGILHEECLAVNAVCG